MGEKIEGESKAADAVPAKKGDGCNDTVVLKMDMHCEGCAKKVRRVVRHFEGVESVESDSANNKLTVTGKVDPAKIKEKLENKIQKKVEIISPPPKKDAGGDKKPEEKTEKKPEEKKPEEKKVEEEKKPKSVTVLLKVQLHCEGCITKMRKIIQRTKGVESVEIHRGKDQVTVTGTMDVKELIPYLREKLKRSVDLVPPPKKDEGAGGDKKENKEGEKKDKEKDAPASAAVAPAPEKKDAAADAGKKEEATREVKVEENGGPPKMELSRFEHRPLYYQGPPSYMYNPGPSYHSQSYSQNYAMEPYNYQTGYANVPPPPPAYATLPPPTYATPYYGYEAGYTMDPRLDAPQMFSDENPNACSVM